MFEVQNSRAKPLVRLYDVCGTSVIVSYPSGVIYSNQAGGYSCEQPELEGFVIPVGNEEFDTGIHSPENDLLKYFEGPKYQGTGAFGLDIEDADFIDQTLKKYFLSSWISVDRSKLSASFEAWVWVKIKKTQDGMIYEAAGSGYDTGVLTWTNSD